MTINDNEQHPSDDSPDSSDDTSSASPDEIPENKSFEQPDTTTYDDTTTSEKCTFDMKNLLALNEHQIDTSELYDGNNTSKEQQQQQQQQQEEKEEICIQVPDVPKANELYLLQKSSEACQQLISELWKLPTFKRNDASGPIAVLPKSFEVKLPRALPPPPPKQETKWEKFAKERNIQPQKRDRKVFDVATQTWKYRHGYEKANASSKEWPIMEVKPGQDPYENPWQKVRDAKKTRVDQNVYNRLKNEERGGLLPRGVARRVLRDTKEKREMGRSGSGSSEIPSGVPVDLKANKISGEVNGRKRGKDLTNKALVAVQRSTASLGNFDAMREGEPERKKAIRKRKFDSAMDGKVIKTETEKGMKVLERVLNGGAQKDKAKRKGSLAKGETAYDYDFDDGLGGGTFRKKKGRAGAGKMKKVTKKRIK